MARLSETHKRARPSPVRPNHRRSTASWPPGLTPPRSTLPTDPLHEPHGPASVTKGLTFQLVMSPLSCSSRRFGLSCMLGDPRKNCFGLQMHAQWYLSGGRRQMHRAFAPLARWVILTTGPRAAFMNDAQLLGTAPRRFRSSVTLTHPCQHAAAYLPCTRPPDALYPCRTCLTWRSRPRRCSCVRVESIGDRLCRVHAHLPARPGPMPSEGHIISRPSRYLIRRATSLSFKGQHFLFADLFPLLGKFSLLYS